MGRAAVGNRRATVNDVFVALSSWSTLPPAEKEERDRADDEQATLESTNTPARLSATTTFTYQA